MEQHNITRAYEIAAEIIKNAILQGQYEAAKGINRIQLATYFSIGKYVSVNTRQGVWGTGALNAISTRLRQLLPGLRGYSADSLKLMRIFYEEWKELDATPLETEREKAKSLIAINDLDNTPNWAVSTCKCTARKVKEYFRKNTQAGYENLIFLSGDGLFCQQLC